MGDLVPSILSSSFLNQTSEVPGFLDDMIVQPLSCSHVREYVMIFASLFLNEWHVA